MTNVILRPGNAADAQLCGAICYNAFEAVAEQHGFPPDFPSPEVATGVMTGLLAHAGFYSVVAEVDGKVVGSNFLDERSIIAGIGPITVDPALQNCAVGRQLMEDVLDRARQRRFPGVRLLQATYHNRSLALYARLGFVAREPISTMQGTPLAVQLPGYSVRPATDHDLDACNGLCAKVHGHDRGGELLDAVRRSTATVVEIDGRIAGYATSVAFFGHAVGETNEAVKALIGAAPSFGGPGLLVPTRNAELFRWCLDHGLRVVQPMNSYEQGFLQRASGRLSRVRSLLSPIMLERSKYQDAFIHSCATDAAFFLFSCWDCPFVRGLWSWGMDSVTLVGYRHDCHRRAGFGRCCICPHSLPSLTNAR